MQVQQAAHTALARSLSPRERRARALAQAEADAAQREAAEAEAELGAVAAEVARLATAQPAPAPALEPEPAEPEPASSGVWTPRTLQIEGTIACAIRHEAPLLWPSRRCRTALQAAQLRLVLGFLHSERLTERCPLALEAGRVTGTIIGCFEVRFARPAPLPTPLRHPTPPAKRSVSGWVWPNTADKYLLLPQTMEYWGGAGFLTELFVGAGHQVLPRPAMTPVRKMIAGTLGRMQPRRQR